MGKKDDDESGADDQQADDEHADQQGDAAAGEAGEVGTIGWLRSSDDVRHGFIRAIDSLRSSRSPTT
jgi:hypothetical protein